MSFSDAATSSIAATDADRRNGPHGNRRQTMALGDQLGVAERTVEQSDRQYRASSTHKYQTARRSQHQERRVDTAGWPLTPASVSCSLHAAKLGPAAR